MKLVIGWAAMGLLLLGTSNSFAQIPDAAQVQRDLWSLLRERTVYARVAPELQMHYPRVAEQDRAVLGRIYATDLFKVQIKANEEWSTSSGESDFLLEKDRYDSLQRTLGALTSRVVKDLPLENRLLLQNELWAAFDELYRTGIAADNILRRDQRQRISLLHSIARAIFLLAIPQDELSTLKTDRGLVERFDSQAGNGVVQEIFSLQDFTVHDAVMRFRTVGHTYLISKNRDLSKWAVDDLQNVTNNGFPLLPGERAIFIEYMLSVAPNGFISITRVPKIVREYAVEKNKVTFSLFNATLGNHGIDYHALDVNDGGWGELDLPAIPHRTGVGVRVPWYESCRGCHDSGNFKSFSPYPFPRQARYTRIIPPGREDAFIDHRVISLKVLTPEAAALILLMHSEETPSALDTRGAQLNSQGTISIDISVTPKSIWRSIGAYRVPAFLCCIACLTAWWLRRRVDSLK